MHNETTIDIDATPSQVWDTYVEVERWPEWTASVEQIVPLDGVGIEVGNRFAIKQPRFPRLVWVVTQVDPGRSWIWEQRSFGGHTVATHEVEPTDEGGARARMSIDQSGPIGAAVAVLTKGLTRRYLDLEAQGLKARYESG